MQYLRNAFGDLFQLCRELYLIQYDVVKKDMKLVGMREDDAEDRGRCRQMIRCGDQKGNSRKEKKKIFLKKNKTILIVLPAVHLTAVVC